MRVSLISLAGASAFAMLAYLILALPHPEWRGLVENLFAVLLVLMLVAAFAGKHRSRSFGIGFIAAACVYLAACFAPGFQFRDKMFTHQALQYARKHCADDAAERVAFNSPAASPLNIPSLRATPVSTAQPADRAAAATVLSDRANDERYFFVGHLLWATLIGFVGGALGAAMTTEPPR